MLISFLFSILLNFYFNYVINRVLKILNTFFAISIFKYYRNSLFFIIDIERSNSISIRYWLASYSLILLNSLYFLFQSSNTSKTRMIMIQLYSWYNNWKYNRIFCIQNYCRDIINLLSINQSFDNWLKVIRSKAN